MGLSKTEVNLKRLLVTAPQQQNQAKLIHELLEQLADERNSDGLPRVSKAKVNEYAENIEAVAAKLAVPMESTIGAAFFSQTVAVNDATVKFEIWDTAGQERYHSLAPMYYRGAAAAIIVYDITNQASFDRAKKWVQELQAQGNPNMVMALAGNKADLLDARKVAAEEAQTYAEENGLFFMETSAKTASNVNDVFSEIAKRLPRLQPAQNPSGMVLMDRPAQTPAAASCCS